MILLRILADAASVLLLIPAAVLFIEVAAAAGITPRYLQMLERGTANPSYIALRALASTLQVDLTEVIKRAELLDAR